MGAASGDIGVTFLWYLCMWLSGVAGVGGPVPGTIGPGVKCGWALSVSSIASFAGIRGWFLGVFCMTGGLLGLGRGACVLL